MDRTSEAAAMVERGPDLDPQVGSAHSIAAEMIAPRTQATQPAQPAQSIDDHTIPLRAERLAIGKVRVANGEARIRKEVITQLQSIDVLVSHEELVIERHVVTDGAVAGSGAIGVDQTIIVPLAREDIKVSKKTYITEEVDIGRHAIAQTARVSEAVRHEELVVAPSAVTDPPMGPR